MSGVPILKGTRLQADSIVSNFEAGSPVEEIEENFGIPQPILLKVLAYARSLQNATTGQPFGR